jgi:hypothetical protein
MHLLKGFAIIACAMLAVGFAIHGYRNGQLSLRDFTFRRDENPIMFRVTFIFILCMGLIMFCGGLLMTLGYIDPVDMTKNSLGL